MKKKKANTEKNEQCWPTNIWDSSASNNVNNPPHYTSGDIECIHAIESALTEEEFRGYCKGNALKYIWRSGLKNDAKEDIQKAQWYLAKLLTVI